MNSGERLVCMPRLTTSRWGWQLQDGGEVLPNIYWCGRQTSSLDLVSCLHLMQSRMQHGGQAEVRHKLRQARVPISILVKGVL